jgi:hypothetical protein
MSTLGNPYIPHDNNLTMALDVSNPKSYSGSGTVWKDLVNGLIFNSTGTQTPIEVINNAKSFAFNGSGYWYCNSGYNLVDLGGDMTLLMWLYSEAISIRKTVFEKAGTSYASYEQEIACTWETGNEVSWYSRYNAYDYGSTAACTIGSWNLVGIKMNTGKTATARAGYYSKNGGVWTQNYTSRSTTAITAAGEIRIGAGYAGTCDVGNVGMVLTYNKMLSDSEVLAVYNATKRRYGLNS